MTEKLAFGYGTSRHTGDASAASIRAEPLEPPARLRDRRDWAYAGLMTFTALLFFRPQDQLPALDALHLAELSALVALVALTMGRLRRGLTIVHTTPELIGVVAFGAIILATAPFSVWKGGAVATFTDLYVKVVLIFVLMVNTLRTPRRIEQFTWLIVAATGYIAFRAAFDYVRGINLVENGRVQGAIGGMFRNPNDLALNMVAVLPLAASIALRPGSIARRALASTCALFMLVAVVASQSRSGSIGLVVMTLVMAALLVRRRPGMVCAGALAIVLALPLVPSSYWHRLSSITDETQDDTGSREARATLLRESYAAFLANPLTGVGAGQFKNYNPDARQQAWRESHNVLLQVASELGVFGLITFCFLIARGLLARRQTSRLLNRAPVPVDERTALLAHSAAVFAGLCGWFVCALFASVAYNWTFYYLLALSIAPREVLMDRLASRAGRGRRPIVPSFAAQGIRA